MISWLLVNESCTVNKSILCFQDVLLPKDSSQHRVNMRTEQPTDQSMMDSYYQSVCGISSARKRVEEKAVICVH